MNRKKICSLLAVSLLLTGTFGINSYASEQEIYMDILETEPVTINEDTDVGVDTYQETYSPADAGQGTVSPISDNDEDGSDRATEVQESTGMSSMPDPEDLELVREDVINMLLPVIPEKTYDFTLDPKDLISRYGKSREDYDKASLYFTNVSDNGIIRHSNRSDAALAINKSTVPVLLSVSIEVENDYDWPVRYTAMDMVENDEEMNLSFSLIPVINRPEDEADDENTTTEILDDLRIDIDENGMAEMKLLIPAALDNFEDLGDGYVLKEDAAFTTYGWIVEGACNTLNDWEEIVDKSSSGENINIRLTYQLEALTEEEAAELPEDVLCF